ncbi:hypothetical protein MothHH_00320 [Moorella thermoacetica]|nr:hypothetical protein MOTHA_c03120 [Moorella thermoacetica]OIQ54515.1 hypothetical protein MOCA_21840 [Moorella thermoacetica]QCZ99490.1 hypothetical protein MothHH_00320 [Moorella thermoacetica]TYL07150.1 hypothetical protein MOOCA_22580 [Moorella thermoacetica]TYL07517.1 hypothetical protein MOLA_21780 [Moorella thermoacetica]
MPHRVEYQNNDEPGNILRLVYIAHKIYVLIVELILLRVPLL